MFRIYNKKIDSLVVKEKNGTKNLGILRRIVLNVLKFVQCYYNKMSLKLIRFDISMDVEEGLEITLNKLLKENT